jgi:hypothetical protein
MTKSFKIFDEIRNHLADRFIGSLRLRIKHSDMIKYVLEDIKLSYCEHADREQYKCKRHFAHTGCKKDTICITKYIEKLPEKNITGILIHEIGHLLEDNFIEDNHVRDHEVFADMVMLTFFGVHIFYSTNDKIQWVDLDGDVPCKGYF